MKFTSLTLFLSSILSVAAFVPLHLPTPTTRSASASASSLATQLYERKPFITGNWKLNPTTLDEAINLAKGISGAVVADSPGDVALFVPYPFLQSVKEVVGDKVAVGAEVRQLGLEIKQSRTELNRTILGWMS